MDLEYLPACVACTMCSDVNTNGTLTLTTRKCDDAMSNSVHHAFLMPESRLGVHYQYGYFERVSGDTVSRNMMLGETDNAVNKTISRLRLVNQKWKNEVDAYVKQVRESCT